MLDNKQRIIRLLENQINDYYSENIRLIYGPGAKIKIKTISEGLKSKSILVEGVVILGSVISEEVLEADVADVFIQNISAFIFPNHTIISYVWFDV